MSSVTVAPEIDFGLIPDEYDLERRVYNFNKYVKKMKLDNSYYGLDNIPKEWIDKRLRGIAIRQNLTDEWKSRGITKEEAPELLS